MENRTPADQLLNGILAAIESSPDDYGEVRKSFASIEIFGVSRLLGSRFDVWLTLEIIDDRLVAYVNGVAIDKDNSWFLEEDLPHANSAEIVHLELAIVHFCEFQSEHHAENIVDESMAENTEKTGDLLVEMYLNLLGSRLEQRVFDLRHPHVLDQIHAQLVKLGMKSLPPISLLGGPRIDERVDSTLSALHLALEESNPDWDFQFDEGLIVGQGPEAGFDIQDARYVTGIEIDNPDGGVLRLAVDDSEIQQKARGHLFAKFGVTIPERWL